MTTIRTRIASLLAAALCVSLLAAPAGAYARVDVDRDVSLTLNYYDEEREFAFEGMEVSIYKVLDMSDAVRFTPDTDGPFANYFGGGEATVTVPSVDESEVQVSRDDFDSQEAYQAAWDAEWARLWQEEWTGLASTLLNYLSADETIVPTAVGAVAVVNEGTEGETGQVVFTQDSAGNPLDVGVYLVAPAGIEDGRYTYTPQSYLVSLPNLSGDEWMYDAQVRGDKFERSYDGGGGGGINRNVMKVWEDAGVEGVDRPSSVTVQLLRDGEVYDEVELSEDNDWEYSWRGLSSRYDWTLVETDVPGDYTVEIDRQGNTFVVTNTAAEEIEDPDTPLDPGPGPDDPGDPTDPTDPGTDIPDPDVPLDPGLPQTGTLWLPVQILTIAGILLFSLGWMDMKRQKRERHEA